MILCYQFDINMSIICDYLLIPSQANYCYFLKRKLSKSWWRMGTQNWTECLESVIDASNILDTEGCQKIIYTLWNRFVIYNAYHTLHVVWFLICISYQAGLFNAISQIMHRAHQDRRLHGCRRRNRNHHRFRC